MWWVPVLKAIGLMILSAVIQAFMAPKPEKPEAGSLDIPSAEEGDSYHVVFGQMLVKEPKILWYGDAKTVAIRKKGGKK